ncbi:T9SS type A sorting domain-containing protein [Hymenobacter busanensis]|uniref:T9SS type A sorting domain-containing protein n=1 Tax=Hymenobacter busanensis TaxID=2607656 RepID=A0A7L4ZX75_9BACT|nr:T9SS type A sorting domain-containing protein [Hymenobacter busanensis]KAA9332216.1 T9SS type A sorting domain-containing protein [Hymenobacter busanensis]QHJ07446.1 T9SS type A sorting domain-containing protein [Hymenobacter busanensis]
MHTLLPASQRPSLFTATSRPGALLRRWAGAALLLLGTASAASAQTPLSGAYTINSGAATGGTNFASFTAAAARLNADGVSGPVTFAVSGGPYTEQVTLNAITGTSATNTITINGNRSVLRFAPSASATRTVLQFNGADYVTINNLVIDATGGGTPGTYGWGVHLMNGSDRNALINCSVISSTTSTSTNYAGIVASGSATSATTAGNSANFLTLQGDTITGGYYGVILNGASLTALAGAHQISGNVIRDFYLYGMDVEFSDGTQIIGNDIHRATRTTGLSTFYGIYLSNNRSSDVERNRIHSPFTGSTSSTSSAYGIYFTANDGLAGQENDVVNNLVYDFNGSGIEYGMYNSSSDYCRYYHNTISLDNTAAVSTSTTAGFYQVTLATGIEFKNNVVSVTRNPTGTGSKYALYFSTAMPLPANLIASNYNDLYVGTGTDFFTGRYSTSEFATLTDWKTANGGVYDQNSVGVNPAFVSLPNNLRPTAAPLNGSATPLARVTTDFTGATRSTTAPDMGAYEFTPAANDAAIVSIVGPATPFAAGTFPATVNVLNNGTTALTSLTLTYVFNGGTAVTRNFTGLNIGAGQTGQLTLTGLSFVNGVNTLTVTGSLPNGGTDANTANDQQTLTTRTALSGAYTINNGAATGGTNFASFTAAAEALNLGGVSAATMFTVSGGPYTEQLTLNEVSGANATRTVTFNGGGRTIKFAANNSAERAVVTLNGADYVTINNLVVDATNGGTPGTYGWGILLTNDADHNTISGCTVTTNAASTSTNFAGIVVSGSATGATTAGASASSLLLENNTVTGGYYGITLVGASATAMATGNIARNNQVKDFYLYGFYLAAQDGTQILANDIHRTTRTDVSTFYGVYLTTSSRNVDVMRNRIHDTATGEPASTATVYGIYMTTGAGAVGAENEVVNNAFYNFNSAGLEYGVYNTGASNVRYYFNTFDLRAPAATTSTSAAYGFYQTTGTNVDFRNNIVAVERAGTGVEYGIYLSSATGVTSTNYNDLYVPGGNVGYYGSAFATLAAWQAANNNAFDQNSVDFNPMFVSASNPIPTNGALNDKGTPIAGITVDITGATRGTTPDVGAFEFSAVAGDVAPAGLVGPSASATCYTSAETLEVQIRNAGTTSLNLATYPATVSVVVTLPGGTTQSFTTTVNTGTLAPNATQNVTLPGTLNMTAQGTYSFAITATVVGDGNTANDVLTPAPTRTMTVAGPVATFSYPQGSFCAGVNNNIPPTLGAGATAGSFSATPAGLTINPTTGVISVATSTAGTYTITNVAPANGTCPAVSATTTFTVRATPAAPTLTMQTQPDGSVVLTSSAPNGNLFYLNGSPLGGVVNGSTLTLTSATQNGVYTVFTNQQGCTSPVSNAVTVVVTSSRSSALAGSNLLVYPNPTPSGLLTLELQGYRKAATLTVLNALGQVVRTQEIAPVASGKHQTEVNLTQLPSGVYTLRVATEGGVDVRRVVRE